MPVTCRAANPSNPIESTDRATKTSTILNPRECVFLYIWRITLSPIADRGACGRRSGRYVVHTRPAGEGDLYRQGTGVSAGITETQACGIGARWGNGGHPIT